MRNVDHNHGPISTPPLPSSPLPRLDKCDSSATRLMLHKFMWFPHKLIDYKLFLFGARWQSSLCCSRPNLNAFLWHRKHPLTVGSSTRLDSAWLEKRKLPATIYKLEIRAHIAGKCSSDGFIGRARCQLRIKVAQSLMQCVSC